MMSNEMNRRKFLKLAGTAAFAVSAAGLLAGCEDEPVSSSSRPTSSSSRPASSSSKPTSSSSSSQPESNLKIIWKYKTNDTGVTITGYDTSGAIPTGNVTIPSTWAQYPVTAVSGNMGGKITKLTIPGSVKKVDRMGSSNLQEVVLQNGVEELGDYAFDDSTNLSRVTIPATLKKIGWCAFASCTSLTSISLPAGLKTLDYKAFNNTGLISVTVPASVDDVGSYVFQNCKNLTKVVYNGSIVEYAMFQNCVSLTSVALNNNIQKLCAYAFAGCKSLTSITLPANLQTIKYDAFLGCTKLTMLTLPSKTTQIEYDAFRESGLMSLKFVYGTTEIASGIFQDAKAFTKVYIPASVTKINYNAFAGTNLKDVYYGSDNATWKALVNLNGEGNGLIGPATFHYNAMPSSF